MANHFDESLIAHQLNCAGVLPAMKIARAGFAMRYHHEAFIQRYRPIVYKELIRRRSRRIGGHQLTCQFLISLLADRLESEMRKRTILSQTIKIDDIKDIVAWGLQVGKSKVFLRTLAFEALEELRNSTINKAAVVIQAQTRSFLCQNKFYLILGSVLTLQCAARKLIACVHVHQLRCHDRSITIQSQWRSYHAWYQYQNILYITTWCQRFWRGKKVREEYVVIKQYRSAIVIQSAWRSHAFQQCHRELRNAAITIQCFYRVIMSSRMMVQLKREAKNVKNIAMERDKLRMELKQMKRELERVKNRHNINDNRILPSDHSFTSARTSDSQEEMICLLSQQCAKKDQELRMLRQEVDTLRQGSVMSRSSTLPLTVTIDSASPLSGSDRGLSPSSIPFLPSRESPLSKSVGLIESALTKKVELLPSSPSLLDSEVEDVPQLECSQVSLPDSSVDVTEERINISSVKSDSSFIDCMKIDELPFHQAVQNDDKEMLLEEINNASDLELYINSADSKGR